MSSFLCTQLNGFRNTRVKVHRIFDIVAGALQGDTLAPYLFIICLDYVLRTSIDKIWENGFELTKKRSRRYPAKTITDADFADDIAILANTPNQAEILLYSLERAAAGIGLHVNAHKTEYMCYNKTGDIIYLGSSVSSTEKDIDMRLTKAWTAIDWLSIIWKSDLTDKMKRSFFQAAVVSILLYGCTTWTLTKQLEKKLDGNYTRMLRAILRKSWRQHLTRHQLYGHLPPITKTIQVRRTRHAGHWAYKWWTPMDPTYGRAKAGRPARTYIQQGCSPEDLLGAMKDREKWRERVRDISASDTTWWWWWWFLRWIFLFTLNRLCESHGRDISTLNGDFLKLVDKLTDLRSSVSSTEKDINMRLAKACTAIDRLSIKLKSDLSVKIKRNFSRAVLCQFYNMDSPHGRWQSGSRKS